MTATVGGVLLRKLAKLRMIRLRAQNLRAAWYCFTDRPVMFGVAMNGGTVAFGGDRGFYFGGGPWEGVDFLCAGRPDADMPPIRGLVCASHELPLEQGEDGSYRCPMDGEVHLRFLAADSE